ncbi:MAG: ABC transporter permease [Sphaerochaetaceae bacterium]|nr:ABC transporter permease [Sphaerochaetaceae bacterium]NLO60469.1 ABC transporter permease [Spirochaetales bacterium]MDD2405052.1 ABC transporter permease [Sphaerochaetaceae bacterium]MDD3669692.1 ABC transporter permease [Sphaerochaetaceae bacterium]MDD4258603.1 ABC transporter permease [Sphaerochaetaceae bacterium]
MEKLAKGKRKITLNQSLLLVFVIIGLIIIATIVNPRFIRVGNLVNILQQISVLGIIASGVGMLLIAGQIDISVGSQVSLMGIIMALIIEKSTKIPPTAANAWMSAWAEPFAVIVTILLGAFLGLFTGFVVIKSKASSFIVTLALGSVYKGIALLISKGASFSLFGNFELLGRGQLFNGMPVSILFLVLVVALTYVLLKYTRYGRFLYSIGGNRKAAFVSGINTTMVTMRGFITVGLLNALAALILISRVGTALATTADAYSLDALAAIVVGGVSITGGKGTAMSVFLGVLLIGLVGNALVVMNINPYLRGVAIGAIIIISVTFGEMSETKR